jgi:hypothetical protein
VANGGDEDSMLQFQLKRGVDGMKYFQKIKWRQQTHLGSIERKCNTT